MYRAKKGCTGLESEGVESRESRILSWLRECQLIWEQSPRLYRIIRHCQGPQHTLLGRLLDTWRK